jgi:CRP/FNR family cyclic AMP-dependent transcriptional regulator
MRAGRGTIALMIAARPLAETLATVPFFSGLDAPSLESVGRGMRARRFRRGEVIFHLGDPGDALFIVMSGAIKIMLPSDTGDEAILATLRGGDVFGELALLDGAPRSATAVALEPTETLILPRAQFRELLATEPAIRDALLAALAGELRRLTNHVEELHFLDITGRLASRLARLATEGGRKQPDGSIRLPAPLTQGDLAAMIGCTRQSVNKLLGMFTDDGLIRLDRDSIVVLELDGLLRTARR